MSDLSDRFVPYTHDDLVFTHLPRVTGRWGQWYQHTIARLRSTGEEAFRIQTRRRYFGKNIGHRMEVITLAGQSCVMGSQSTWGLQVFNETKQKEFDR